MIYKVADNILSPLGKDTEENYAAVKRGESGLSYHEGLWNIPEPFMASMFDDNWRKTITKGGISLFEATLLISLQTALSKTSIDVTKDRVALILSTTKGDVDSLQCEDNHLGQMFLGTVAQHIADTIGVRSTPVVVCNACISGLSAIILAQRLLEQETFDYAIVSGCDVMSKFIVSGFQSFKVLSPERCRPFDMERSGLNLGESAATIIFSRQSVSICQWGIETGAIRNDAFHISTPSNKGEGLYRALAQITHEREIENMALINVHGTATLFNDTMEAIAICRAGLASLPVNALKGYFGHTMGASGILETILTMRALDDNMILGSKGFDELGVSRKIDISAKNRYVHKSRFIKVLSGFGGCNAAIIAAKVSQVKNNRQKAIASKCIHNVKITPVNVSVDGKCIKTACQGSDILIYLYRHYIADYPKFYKMDMLSRLGFVAAELLLIAEGRGQQMNREDRAIVFLNRSSSISADMNYLRSIENMDSYYPSPSIFVYTLPNIVAGEIAIRNGYHGETSFYILPNKNERQIETILETTFQDSATKSILGGWIDFEDNEHFEADIRLLEI